jgi:uncharacterized protein YaaQ
MSDYSYIGSGKIYLREIGGTGGLLEVGNASALAFAVEEEIKELKDYTQAGGGTYNEVRRVDAVTVSMTLHDLNPENLSRALYGNATAIASATVTDEVHDNIVVGGLVMTDYLATAITAVKRGATTLTLGTDYEVRPGGVVMLTATPNNVVDGDDILITYSKAASDVIEAITSAGREYQMVFDGLNEARSGKRTRVVVHRVKVGAAKELGLIGDEYAAIEAEGKILKDTSITGAGLSQYFKVDVER